ncbi:MAG: dihydroneopterin aldolase [Bacteroidales bacterium]|nr:dihydroneopterin aldolase [Bacteroidales bacterium]
MGKIILEDMEFYAYHGCFKEERVVGNIFIVNLTIETNMDNPSKTDDIKDALNYQTIYKLVKEQMQVKSHLLENIAKRILDSLLSNFKNIEKVSVKVSKMNPPIGGKLKCVSVSIER